MNKKTIFVCAVIIVSLLPIPNAQVAMVKLSLEQLTQDADLVVVGTVQGVKSEMTKGKIFSFATVSVNSRIKGDLEQGQNKIVVRFPGGTVGDIAVKVEDSPEYTKDENIVVFLKDVPNQTHFETVGSFQGKFLIKDNIVVRENLSLDQFLERIQNIICSGR